MVIAGLRWLAVLPTGVLAVIIIMFPVHWLVLLGTSLFSEDLGIWMIPPKTLERLAQAFVATSGIVYFGALMAPNHKFVTAVVLGIVVGAGLIVMYAWIFTSNRFVLDYSGLGWVALGGVAGLNIVGIAAGIAGVRYRQRESGEI